MLLLLADATGGDTFGSFADCGLVVTVGDAAFYKGASAGPVVGGSSSVGRAKGTTRRLALRCASPQDRDAWAAALSAASDIALAGPEAALAAAASAAAASGSPSLGTSPAHEVGVGSGSIGSSDFFRARRGCGSSGATGSGPDSSSTGGVSLESASLAAALAASLSSALEKEDTASELGASGANSHSLFRPTHLEPLWVARGDQSLHIFSPSMHHGPSPSFLAEPLTMSEMSELAEVSDEDRDGEVEGPLQRRSLFNF